MQRTNRGDTATTRLTGDVGEMNVLRHPQTTPRRESGSMNGAWYRAGESEGLR